MESVGSDDLSPVVPPEQGESDHRVSAYEVTRPTRIVIPSRTLFGLFWWLVFAFHAGNALFVLLFGGVHLFISLPVVYDEGALLRIPRSVLSIAGWTYVVIAVYHSGAMGRMVIQSLMRRQLSFGNEPTTAKTSVVPSQLPRPPSHATPPIKKARIRFFDRILDSLAAFGLDGRHFDDVMCARQGVEIVLQTYQAEQVSRAVARLWVTNVVTTLLVANCLFMPLTELYSRRYARQRRVLIVAIDLVLEFLICVGVPIAVIAPYAAAFDWTRLQFPDELGYSDVWFMALLSELRQVLVSSATDYVSSVVPHLAIIAGLGTIKGLFCHAPTLDSLAASLSRFVSGSLVLQRRKSAQSQAPPAANSLVLVPRRRRRRLWLFHGVTLAWAVAAIAIQATARQRARDGKTDTPGLCALQVFPWFAGTHRTCSVAHLNCHRLGSTGTARLTTLLETLDRHTLSKLTFSHCAALTMPAIVSEFPNLLALETFNVSLVAWSDAAAVLKRRHAHMIQVQLIDTNMTTFPMGLMSAELPSSLNLLIFRSNLTAIPETVGHVWTGHLWRYFKVEHTKLTSLPRSLGRVNIRRLSLIGNEIKRIDDDLFASQSFTSIRLSHNPLVELPANVGDVSDLRLVMADHTMVETVPPWIEEWRSKRVASRLPTAVSLSGTPLCMSAQGSITALCEEAALALQTDFRYDIMTKLRPVD